MDLPARLSDINADFMTRLLRARGLLADHNEIIRIDESGVGMTAGYFSDIKKLHCHFKEPTECPSHFVAKAWPDFEMLPGETISDMFVKDIKGYMLPAEHFFPRPEVFLADFDQTSNHYGLIMADVDQFGTQKVHEQELTFDEVMQMIPGLVDCAVSWEGCDTGPAASTLTEFGVAHWSSPENLALYKEIMPAGAKLFDKVLSMPESDLTGGASWQAKFGTGVAELFTQKLDAHFAQIDPSTGATCTLSHGDLRGDNLFFCPKSDANPEGWLTIDFQLMFKGPVPSDLAYLMSSGSVLPEVYSAANRDRILKAFYDQFMGKTRRYPNYTFQQFEAEFAAMCSQGVSSWVASLSLWMIWHLTNSGSACGGGKPLPTIEYSWQILIWWVSGKPCLTIPTEWETGSIYHPISLSESTDKSPAHWRSAGLRAERACGSLDLDPIDLIANRVRLADTSFAV
jgi:hypothetical protein